MLADRAIASLDPKSSRTVMEHLRWAADELGCCLAWLNLHQVDFACEFSDRIVALKKGQLVFDGSPADLTEEIIADITIQAKTTNPAAAKRRVRVERRSLVRRVTGEAA